MEASQPGIEIGATLRDARRRAGYDIRTVEDLTKIRIKYLRALENEEWDVLPAPAYVRGFLRSYAEVVGLDGEVLVDEYRYRVETVPERSYPHAEPVLSERRSRMRRPQGPLDRNQVLVVLGAAIVVLLLILGIFGGGGDDEPRGEGERRERGVRQGGGGNSGEEERDRGPVTLLIAARSNVEAVCVVSGKGKELLNDSLLEVGIEEKFTGSKRYVVDLGSGNVRFKVNGENQTVATSEPASYQVNADGVHAVGYTGDSCP